MSGQSTVTSYYYLLGIFYYLPIIEYIKIKVNMPTFDVIKCAVYCPLIVCSVGLISEP